MEPPSSPSPVDSMDIDSGSFDVFGFVAAEQQNEDFSLTFQIQIFL